MPQENRKNRAVSYRFDPDTLVLIGRLVEVLPDPSTGQRRSATDIIRLAVRNLAKKYLPDTQK